MKKILVYSDAGAEPCSVKSIVRALKIEKMDQHFSIQLVKKSTFYDHAWHQDTALVIFPGGRDIPYHQALQGFPNQSLIQFVESGGKFLGICAGGYYGSAEVEFEKGGPLEVIDKRELKFFPGKTVGPALGLRKFQYNSQCGAEIAKLTSPLFGDTAAYYNGGCYFEATEHHTNVMTLATFENGKTAIVKCKVVQGIAILSGVHPEYMAIKLFEKHLDGIFDPLQEIEQQRRLLFSSLLQELSL